MKRHRLRSYIRMLLIFCVLGLSSTARGGWRDWIPFFNGNESQCEALVGFEPPIEKSLRSSSEVLEGLKTDFDSYWGRDDFNDFIVSTVAELNQLKQGRGGFFDILSEKVSHPQLRVGGVVFEALLQTLEQDQISYGEFLDFVVSHIDRFYTYTVFRDWIHSQVGSPGLLAELRDQRQITDKQEVKQEMAYLIRRLSGNGQAVVEHQNSSVEEMSRVFLFLGTEFPTDEPSMDEVSLRFRFGQAAQGAPLWYHQTGENQLRLFGRVHEIHDSLEPLFKWGRAIETGVKKQLEDEEEPVDVNLVVTSRGVDIDEGDFLGLIQDGAKYGFLPQVSSVSLVIDGEKVELFSLKVKWMGTSEKGHRYYGVGFSVSLETIGEHPTLVQHHVNIGNLLETLEIPTSDDGLIQELLSGAVSNPMLRLYSRSAHGAQLKAEWDMERLHAVVRSRRVRVGQQLEAFLKKFAERHNGTVVHNKVLRRNLWISHTPDKKNFAFVGDDDEIQDLLQMIDKKRYAEHIRMLPGIDGMPGIFQVDGGEVYFGLQFEQPGDGNEVSVLQKFLSEYELEEQLENKGGKIDFTAVSTQFSVLSPMIPQALREVDHEFLAALEEETTDALSTLKKWTHDFEVQVRELSDEELLAALSRWYLFRSGNFGYLPSDRTGKYTLDEKQLIRESTFQMAQLNSSTPVESTTFARATLDILLENIQKELGDHKLLEWPKTYSKQDLVLDRHDLLKGWILHELFRVRFLSGEWSQFLEDEDSQQRYLKQKETLQSTTLRSALESL